CPAGPPMTDEPTAQRVESIEDQSFVYSLADSLLGNEHDADDVAQSAWLALLVRPPQPTHPLRSWLGRVTRNLTVDLQRRRERRASRESAAARAERLPSAAEMFEREWTR